MSAQTKTPAPADQSTASVLEVFKANESIASKPIIARSRQTYDIDSEYNPLTNEKTLPLTVQLSSTTEDTTTTKVFQHPMTRVDFGDTPVFPYFETPFAVLDYDKRTTEGIDWRWCDKRASDTEVFALDFFFSLHDIGYLFAEESTYRKTVLPNVTKTRRHKLSDKHHRPYVAVVHPDKGYLQVYIPSKRDTKKRWHNVAIEIFDMCALMGAGGLAKYAGLVGLEMPDKDSFTKEEKGRMRELLLNADSRFEAYARGDVQGFCPKTKQTVQLLREIFNRCTDQLNRIALMLGARERPDGWGMSTGVVVARMVSEVIATDLGVSVETLSGLTAPGGYQALNHLGKVVNRTKDAFVYLTMVDGGRASSERLLPPGTHQGGKYITRKVGGVYTGVLCDIDISGCYGNGLANQLLPIGIPQVVDRPMKLDDFIRDIRPYTVPGCWHARISWTNAPFACDVLVSKVGESFVSWDYAVDGYSADGFTYEEPDDKAYEASMAIFTHDCHQAALNHDLLQILESCSQRKGNKNGSLSEWEWLLENATISGCIYYDKRYQVKELTPEMLEGYRLSQKQGVAVEANKSWIGYPLSKLVNTLIPERMRAKRTFGKKSAEQEFLKLVVNTIYGCIASVYFNTEDACISNVVAGNNITARARALAWTMAKGLGCLQLITDGGMFDINSVLKWRKGRMSLDALANTYIDKASDIHGNKNYDREPLLGRVLTEDDCWQVKEQERWTSDARANSDWNQPTDISYLQEEIDAIAWNHLAQTFKALDIFKNSGQFWFETKRMFTGFTPHNKVNYRMSNIIVGDNAGKGTESGEFIAFRGMRKEDGRASELFDAYEKGEPLLVTIDRTEILSLSDWRMLPEDMRAHLLPFDQVSDSKRFFSITPLSYRPYSQGDFIATDMKFQKAKEEENASEAVATVLTKALTDSQYSRVVKRLARIK